MMPWPGFFFFFDLSLFFLFPAAEVFFTHGQVSPQFRNGGSLTQLLGDLRRGRLLPQTDPRLRLDVVKLAKAGAVDPEG